MRHLKLSLLVLVFLVACQTAPKTPATALANAEIALTTAVTTSDSMLGAACVDPKSSGCGNALTWHQTFRNSSVAAQTALTAARATLTTDPATSASSLATANAIIQSLNSSIQAGIK